jgi:hypothetical protein
MAEKIKTRITNAQNKLSEIAITITLKIRIRAAIIRRGESSRRLADKEGRISSVVFFTVG